MIEIKDAPVLANYRPAFEFRSHDCLNEAILTVTDSGEFKWHKDAGRLIDEAEFGQSQCVRHVLKRLWAYEKGAQSS
ncbi:hypothetical protein [Burkholderia contaminans]|uniref:hypothetical protein n=1 Tax=Burkholderia contaminans TaxID=488447 RepID=UPI000F5ABF69|nr:hypothetical protein [Burkholderia contaminans]